MPEDIPEMAARAQKLVDSAKTAADWAEAETAVLQLLSTTQHLLVQVKGAGETLRKIERMRQ